VTGGALLVFGRLARQHFSVFVEMMTSMALFDARLFVVLVMREDSKRSLSMLEGGVVDNRNPVLRLCRGNCGYTDEANGYRKHDPSAFYHPNLLAGRTTLMGHLFDQN